MYIEVHSCKMQVGKKVVANCPHCGNGGTFEHLGEDLILLSQQTSYHALHRRCPNPQCRAYVFVLENHDGEIITTLPALRIDFKAEKIPQRIRECLTEAITCHAQACYTASAIMVRRTLEELCQDRGCEGDNLKKRIEGLRSSIVLPKELFDALDELRLLGNDAAHLESKEYDAIGKDEMTIAIELAKEVLKAVYQMDALVAKLKGLKKKP
jgi:hypothetical protein